MMKEVKKTFVVLFALAATAMVFVGCASNKTAVPPEKPVQKTELVDWKGAALNQPVPKWVVAANESASAVQKLKEYSSDYCFVVQIENPDREFATGWVRNQANGAAEISTMISMTVNSMAESQGKGASQGQGGEQSTSQGYGSVQKAMSNTSFLGSRLEADFWTLSHNKATDNQYYTGYSLWTIPAKSLDKQMAENLENIIAKNTELTAAEIAIYRQIIDEILTRGISTTDPDDIQG